MNDVLWLSAVFVCGFCLGYLRRSHSQALKHETPPKSPYRDAPDPAPSLVPFIDTNSYSQRDCPKCKRGDATITTILCVGESIPSGFLWLGRKHGRGSKPCFVSTEHFHVYCSRCRFDRLMAVANAESTT